MTEKFDFEAYADETDYATYDPTDDKLRVYSGRVDRALYDELRRLGFQRAYKQGCFFAVWTPTREDVALALCGDVEEEGGSALERAEARSERFDGYSDNAKARSDHSLLSGVRRMSSPSRRSTLMTSAPSKAS